MDFLISEDLYELLTEDMKSYFRNIDRVTVKGSEKPIKLYTIDLNYDRITPPARKDLKYLSPADMPDSENKRAINLEFLKDEEIEQYNAKVTPILFRNSSWARKNLNKSCTTIFQRTSRSASNWASTATLRANGATHACSTFLAI